MKIRRQIMGSTMSIVAVALVLSALQVSVATASETDFRFRYLGSANVAMPTGYTRSTGLYVADGPRTFLFLSYQVLGKFLELSTTRPTNGPKDDTTAWNVKVNILEEDTWIPNVCYGLGDFREKLGPRVAFFAASKTLDTYGMVLHLGSIKDPTTGKQNVYYGIDKTVAPLVTVVGERMQERNTVGVKLVPQPNLTVQIAREGVGEPNQHDVYQASYQVTF